MTLQTVDKVGVFQAELLEFREFQSGGGRADGSDRSLDFLHPTHDCLKVGNQFAVSIGTAAQELTPSLLKDSPLTLLAGCSMRAIGGFVQYEPWGMSS